MLDQVEIVEYLIFDPSTRICYKLRSRDELYGLYLECPRALNCSFSKRNQGTST